MEFPPEPPDITKKDGFERELASDTFWKWSWSSVTSVGSCPNLSCVSCIVLALSGCNGRSNTDEFELYTMILSSNTKWSARSSNVQVENDTAKWYTV